MPTNSPVSTTPEDGRRVSVRLRDAARPRGLRSQWAEPLTWDHLDGRVHLRPVLSAVELPVEDEVAVVGDHGALRASDPLRPWKTATWPLTPPPEPQPPPLTALLTAMRRLASPPKRLTMVLLTGTYAMGMTSMGTPLFHCWPRTFESFLNIGGGEGGGSVRSITTEQASEVRGQTCSRR